MRPADLLLATLRLRDGIDSAAARARYLAWRSAFGVKADLT
jgi:hypothetical protein